VVDRKPDAVTMPAMRRDEDQTTLAGPRPKPSNPRQEPLGRGRLPRRRASRLVRAQAVDVSFRVTRREKPASEGLDGIVKHRLAVVAGYQHRLPMGCNRAHRRDCQRQQHREGERQANEGGSKPFGVRFVEADQWRV
jgi:hypothetical protein